MAFFCIVSITVTLSIVVCAASLECFNCTGVTNTDSCQNKRACGENEVCFTQKQYSGQISYNLGCMESKKCGNFANLHSGVSRMEIDQGQSHPCFECCSRDGCNSNLCQSKDSDVCVDDEDFDCAYYNSLFNLCEDINQAKKVCPNYCKLCQVVDGHWTPWSNWSDCDVTCENGTQIRSRSCTYPAPQYGGLDCWGNATETKSCHREPCPIHGGWNTWSTWSECSVSCDIGMQHRDRSCTNPRPSLFGDHCFGSDEQYRICMPGACADGGWAAWDSWGTCSKSCAGGIMSRNRACSNPAPSMTGKQCMGNSEQVSLCNEQFCQAKMSAFSVDQPRSYGTYGGVSKLTFSHEIYQNGSDFNRLSGTYKCSIPGTYHFSVTLVKKRASTRVDRVYCYLYKSGQRLIQIGVDPTDDDTDKGNAAISQSVVIHLNVADTVYLSGCTSPPSTYMENWSSFTGFLLYPDN